MIKALEALYDFPRLQAHPLAQGAVLTQRPSGETPGQWLRRELIAAIEALNPGPGIPFRTPQARVYNLMLLHHVEGMTVQEAAHELGISRRQAHRDLRRGQESAAAMLWARRPATPQPQDTRLSSVETEIARLGSEPRPTDLHALLQGALEPLQPLGARLEIRLRLEAAPEPVIVSTDAVIARQVLVNVLSHALRQAQPGDLVVSLASSGMQPTIAFRYVRRPEASDGDPMAEVVVRLAERLAWTVREEGLGEGAYTVTIKTGGRCPVVEIVDDNEGLVELLSDYLAGHACHVVEATSGQQGLRLALEALPDAIVLDVMMPEMDGWEFLQRLRAHPRTAKVPVIICSVINNPDLAYSLGATLVLAKPVGRDDILLSLRKLGIA